MKLQFLWDCLELLFPRTCPSCKNISLKNEPLVCLKCQISMPKQKKHSVIYCNGKKYNVYSAYKFHRKGVIQKLIHEFKYKKHQEIGIFFAEKISARMQELSDCKYIIPVPLHWKKQKIRGYNQSYVMAKRLAELHELEVVDNILIRKHNTISQTKKDRYNRFSEIEDAFILKEVGGLENEHLILIDDIVTTGATICACIQQLEKIDNINISVLCIAN